MRLYIPLSQADASAAELGSLAGDFIWVDRPDPAEADDESIWVSIDVPPEEIQAREVGDASQRGYREFALPATLTNRFRALPVWILDGSGFDDLEGFASKFSRLLGGHVWQGNLDALNDILWGGFGTPEDGLVLLWLNSARSRQALGWDATVNWYERTLTTCHPSNRAQIAERLRLARQRTGTTLFDWIVEILEDHGPGKGQNRVYLDLA